MEKAGLPSYGTSLHYLGERGAEYFAWQKGGGQFAGRINSHKFCHLVEPRHTIVDFGCGGGFLLKNLHCARRIGIEINPAARQQAAELGIETYSSAEDLPDAVADIILSDHALEHIPYPIGALQSLRPKLKPGGTLALCVPIDNWRHQRRFTSCDPNHHLHTWTPQLLGNSLVEAGYEVVSIYARISAWPGRLTVAAYGRLPYWGFRTVCYLYGCVTGKGWEILATARPTGHSCGQNEP